MTPTAPELFLCDLGMLLREKALAARQNAAQGRAEDRDYKLGFLMAYHEVISLVKQQADAFGIDVRSLCLDDIDPDTDLL